MTHGHRLANVHWIKPCVVDVPMRHFLLYFLLVACLLSILAWRLLIFLHCLFPLCILFLLFFLFCLNSLWFLPSCSIQIILLDPPLPLSSSLSSSFMFLPLLPLLSPLALVYHCGQNDFKDNCSKECFGKINFLILSKAQSRKRLHIPKNAWGNLFPEILHIFCWSAPAPNWFLKSVLLLCLEHGSPELHIWWGNSFPVNTQ